MKYSHKKGLTHLIGGLSVIVGRLTLFTVAFLATCAPRIRPGCNGSDQRHDRRRQWSCHSRGESGLAECGDQCGARSQSERYRNLRVSGGSPRQLHHRRSSRKVLLPQRNNPSR